MSKSSPPPYQVFTRQKVDEQIKIILTRCKPGMQPEEIIKIINETLYNRLLLVMPLDKGSPELTIFRITPHYSNFNCEDPKCYSHPPKEESKRTDRCNIAGAPVLYGSMGVFGALSEMKEELIEGANFYLSEWKIRMTELTHAQSLVLNSTTISQSTGLNEMAHSQDKALSGMINNRQDLPQDGFSYAMKRLGDIFTEKGDKYYHISSALAHDALYSTKKQKAKIDILMYPSVTCNQQVVNYAIHPDFVKSENMKLERVFEIKINKLLEKEDDSGVSLDILRRGILTDEGIFRWEKLYYELMDKQLDLVRITTFDGSIYVGLDALYKDVLGQDIVVKDHILKLFHERIESALRSQAGNDQEKLKLDYNGEVHEDNLVMHLEHGCQIKTLLGNSCIAKVEIPIKWVDQYKQVS